MKIGCCFSLWDEGILQFSTTGADYVETGFSSLGDKTIDQVRERGLVLREAGVSLEVMNLLFPGELRLTGPQADFAAVDRYLEENLPKAAALGVDTVVFGSGGARRVPEGFPQEEAFSQLVELGRHHVAPAMEAWGITCCVEPLNRTECNILTTSGECLELVKMVHHPRFQLLIDLYHFDREQEPLSEIAACQEHLRHCHIASAKNSRLIPLPGDGEDYLPFFQALKAGSYQGRLSLEGSMPGGISQIQTSITYLKDLAGQAGL